MLTVDGLRAGYGAVPVLHGVDLEARRGELTLVVGPNGAGKTTLLRSIVGFVRPTAGRVTLDGTPLTRSPDRNARAGVRLVFDGHRIFPELSVEENLRMARLGRAGKRRYAERRAEALDLFPVLTERLRVPASDLSGGQQQLLAVAQALIGSPSVLMVDEPSLGVAQALVPQIMQVLRARAESGSVVVVVEQLVSLVLPFTDVVAVLDRGTVAYVSSTHNESFDSNHVHALLMGEASEGETNGVPGSIRHRPPPG
jgi:branched-chain amino acid transport system ATP-binding protein